MTERTANREQRRAAARRAKRVVAAGSATALVATGVTLVTGSLPVSAAPPFEVVTLDPTGPGSLTDAIDGANAAGGPDTITFRDGLAGTITLTSNLPRITEDVDIVGPGADVITINGAHTFQPFMFQHPGASTISGLTITAGDSAGRCEGNNSAGAIGLYAVQNYDYGCYGQRYTGPVGSLTISNMVINGNHAGNNGGGVWCNSDGYYYASSVGPLTIENTRITGNVADSAGGGLYARACDVTIVSSTVADNRATGGRGGGLHLVYDETDIRNTTISGNRTGGDGGGVFAGGDRATIENSTISGNTAGGNGGGAAHVDGRLELVESTVTGNTSAGGAAGIYTDQAGAAALPSQETPSKRARVAPQQRFDVALTGTIVSGNTGVDLGGDGDAGEIQSLASLLGVVHPGTVVHDLGGTIFSTTPGLGPLADNGGPTLTHALLVGSPAIDSGPEPAPSFPGSEFDQRGPGFARVINGQVDIGAFESEPLPPEPRTPEPREAESREAELGPPEPRFTG